MIGEPDIYPRYSDNPLSWTAFVPDNPYEFLELEYPQPIYVTGVDVYENLGPGSALHFLCLPCIFTVSYFSHFAIIGTVVGMQAKNLQDGTYQTLWSVPLPQFNLPPVFQIFSPPICTSLFPTNVIRVIFNFTVPGWYVLVLLYLLAAFSLFAFNRSEIDAIKMTGLLDLPPGALTSQNRQLIYKPPQNQHGLPLEFFEYKVYDCQTSSPASKVFVSVNAVNNAPRYEYIYKREKEREHVFFCLFCSLFCSVSSANVTVLKGSDVLIQLSGQDVEEDPLTFFITELPSHGTLYQTNYQGVGEAIWAAEISVNFTQISNTKGFLIFHPNPDVGGRDADHFSYVAFDGSLYAESSGECHLS